MSDKTSDKRLENCPFCGGEAGLFETQEGQFGIIHSNATYLCPISDSDSFQGNWTYDTEEEAIAAWNQRKPMERILERLEEYRDDFMDDIYEELREDTDNLRANRIIDRFDEAIEIVKEEGGLND